jgi:hypothetical protein
VEGVFVPPALILVDLEALHGRLPHCLVGRAPAHLKGPSTPSAPSEKSKSMT